MPLDLLLRSNLVQQKLSFMNINSLSLLDKTVQVTPRLMRILGGFLEREVTRDDPEWAAAMASLTVSKKVGIKQSRRQHKENERVCRTVVQQLLSLIPQRVLMRTSYSEKEQEIGTQRKTVTFEEPDQKWGEIEQNLEQKSLSGKKDVEESCRVNEQNPEQESLSGDSDVEESGRVEEQDLKDKILSGELRWMSRMYKSEPAVETCSVTHSSIDNNSRNSDFDTTETGTRA